MCPWGSSISCDTHQLTKTHVNELLNQWTSNVMSGKPVSFIFFFKTLWGKSSYANWGYTAWRHATLQKWSADNIIYSLSQQHGRGSITVTPIQRASPVTDITALFIHLFYLITHNKNESIIHQLNVAFLHWHQCLTCLLFSISWVVKHMF